MGNVTFLLEKLYWEIALFVKDEIVDDGPIWVTEKKQNNLAPQKFLPRKKKILQTKTFFVFAPQKTNFLYKKIIALTHKKASFLN